MFDRMFKKKDNGSYTDLTRRSRKHRAAEYLGRRPRTAPPSGNTSPSPEAVSFHAAARYRHSLNDSDMSPYRASPEPFRYTSPDDYAATSSLEVPPVVPRPTSAPTAGMSTFEDSPCPRMVPQSSGASNELRNPFRNNTSDSFASVGRSNSFESFVELAVPVHRTVRAIRPTQVVESPGHQPQKAAIFTTHDECEDRPDEPPLVASVLSDPFTDSRTISPLSTPSPSGVESPARLVEPAAREPASPRSRWSLLKSPKRSNRDFLPHVNLPAGVMSPMKDSRLAFWSKA
ncbi:hypothetical protein FKP32DRAFT_1570491 [Trametes sanguinea]|nr:hypothetical protein FKP32DRAFT_1570491 [Trametes sanguinea]